MGLSNTYRISVLERDVGSSVTPGIGNTGFSVISSTKGEAKPIKIGAGDTSSLYSHFGYPNATNKELWNVAKYIEKGFDCWVSSPVSSDALYGGVFLTKSGTLPFTSGLSNKTISDFSTITFTETVGTGDGVTTSFSTTLDTNYNSFYVNQSVVIKVDGTELTSLSVSDAEPEVITADELDTGSTYTRATGALALEFLSAVADGEIITVERQVDLSNEAYVAFFNYTACTDDIGVKAVYDTTNSYFTMNVYQKDKNSNFQELIDSPVNFSLVENTKDGFGQNIYIDNVFDDTTILTPVVNTDLAYSTFSDDSIRVNLAGGDRGSAITITERTTGYDYAKQCDVYKADIFFDSSADGGIPTIFSTLRTTHQKYSHYILTLPNESKSSAITTMGTYSLDDRGISVYWNWGKVQDTVTGNIFYAPLTGPVATKHAVMVDVYNALQPAWIGDGVHNGILSGFGILELSQSYIQSDLEELGEAKINPIIKSEKGFMIENAVTTKITPSPMNQIGHSRLADYIISNVISNVLIYQIEQLNDAIHRQTVSQGCINIISPLKPVYLINYTIKCDEENNNDIIQAQEKFILQVAVKYTGFSKETEFIFTNVSGDISVEEAV